MRISLTFFPLLDSAKQTLDIKVKSPWPNQITGREISKEFLEPEHVLIRKVREGVRCRLICLEPESYREFFHKNQSLMAESPYFEEVQDVLEAYEKAGGKIRRIQGTEAELSFAIADGTRAMMFLGAWPKPGDFRRTVFETSEPKLIKFLIESFELCWTAV